MKLCVFKFAKANDLALQCIYTLIFFFFSFSSFDLRKTKKSIETKTGNGLKKNANKRNRTERVIKKDKIEKKPLCQKKGELKVTILVIFLLQIRSCSLLFLFRWLCLKFFSLLFAVSFYRLHTCCVYLSICLCHSLRYYRTGVQTCVYKCAKSTWYRKI